MKGKGPTLIQKELSMKRKVDFVARGIVEFKNNLHEFVIVYLTSFQDRINVGFKLQYVFETEVKVANSRKMICS